MTVKMSRKIKRILTAACICICFIFVGIKCVPLNGAVEPDKVLHYNCDEKVWYQIKENQKIELETSDGLSQTICVNVLYNEQGVEIKEERSFGNIHIGKGSWCRGIYVMAYAGEIYFAAELCNADGEMETCLWREKDRNAVCIPGTLKKENGCIEICGPLPGGYEMHVTMEIESWTQEEEVIQAEKNTYVLSRPLLLLQDAKLRQDSACCILPAGTCVEFADYKKDREYEWYGINVENEIWWIPTGDGRMVLQDAGFEDCFAPESGNADVYAGFNTSWKQMEACFGTFYGTGKRIQLCDYIETFPERVTLVVSSDKEATIGIIDFDADMSSVFVAFQYPSAQYDEDGAVWSRHVCKLYRLVGNWLVPLLVDGYDDGEIPLRLFKEDVEGWSEGYTDEPVSELAHNGTIQIEGRQYQLQGLNHLVETEDAQ